MRTDSASPFPLLILTALLVLIALLGYSLVDDDSLDDADLLATVDARVADSITAQAVDAAIATQNSAAIAESERMIAAALQTQDLDGALATQSADLLAQADAMAQTAIADEAIDARLNALQATADARLTEALATQRVEIMGDVMDDVVDGALPQAIEAVQTESMNEIEAQITAVALDDRLQEQSAGILTEVARMNPTATPTFTPTATPTPTPLPTRTPTQPPFATPAPLDESAIFTELDAHELVDIVSGFGLAWSPDGSLIAAGAGDDVGIALYDAVSGAVKQMIPWRTDFTWSLSWSPDARLLAAGDDVGNVAIWDIDSGELVLETQGGIYVDEIVWSPDGGQAAFITFDEVGLIDIEAGALVDAFLINTPGTGLSWSPDGQRLVYGLGSTNELLDVTDGVLTYADSFEYTETLYRFDARPTFSPDGAWIASHENDSLVVIWDAETLAPLHSLSGHRADITDLAWSPTGDRLATISDDSTLRIWDPFAGVELYRLESDASIWTLDWAPDGRSVAFLTTDLLVWTIPTDP